MNKGLLLAVGVVYVLARVGMAGLAAAPIVAPTDMSGVFTGPGSSADAKAVASHLDGLAEVLEADADREPPLMQTDIDVEKLRVESIWYLGRKLSRSYPGFGEVAGKFLAERVGTEPGELTDTQRRRWVQAYRDLADSCRAAAGGW